MKKIDLHIHTIPTIHEPSFEFDLSTLERYVDKSSLDAIAITNHNLFDTSQFAVICDAINIAVFPGIEVTLECGHILVISEQSNLDKLAKQAEQVNNIIVEPDGSLSMDDFARIFNNLGDYLVIPHYFKKPAIRNEGLERFSDYIFSGEVDCAKKFLRVVKDETKLVPLLFSDARVCKNLGELPTRQTYVDCGELNFASLKACLKDKSKVALSEYDGNFLFQILPNGQKISTGLNILVGARSSGKTYTLNDISASHGNVKYIKQFSLVQQDDDSFDRDFANELKRTRSQFVEGYLSEFKTVLNDFVNVDLRADERAVANYVSSLTEAAEEADRRDAFSKTALFDESEFTMSDDTVLIDLIASARQLIENVEYSVIISRHIDRTSLQNLAIELIELLWEKGFEKKKKKLINSLVRDIKEILVRRTSAVQIQDVDLYRVCINRKKAAKFAQIVKNLQEYGTISEEHIQGFQVVASKAPFEGALEIQKASGTKAAFSSAFAKYNNPYDYLQDLMGNERLIPSEVYKLFAKITYKILNKDGYEVSGGERSEFRLLQEIKDAQNYDILLIDEPESSFDNIFLRSDVNQIIREVSETMPVVVVTHNSTVGASVKPDYILYTSKEIEDKKVIYRIYSGYPTDMTLCSQDGKTISTHEIVLNSLEAGFTTYEDRRQRYEAIKDRK